MKEIVPKVDLKRSVSKEESQKFKQRLERTYNIFEIRDRDLIGAIRSSGSVASEVRQDGEGARFTNQNALTKVRWTNTQLNEGRSGIPCEVLHHCVAF